MSLLTLDEARAAILARVPTLPPEELPLTAAWGRVLREDLHAPRDVPPLDNAGFDGFALRAADIAGADPGRPARLRVVGEVAAGARLDRPVGPGEAVRIMTGAPLPPGVDAVVGVEDTEEVDGDVLVRVVLAPGCNVRRAGEDLPAGARLLESGRRLHAAALGLVASTGRASVAVGRRPRVAVLATGDEILPPGAPWREGAIYSSNSVMLASLVVEAGGEPLDLGIVPDDLAETTRRLEQAFEADAVLTCGGVSMGRYDHVRDAAQALGAQPVFWKVAIKPGKPFFFAMRGACPLFGAPGNPVSAHVTFEMLVRPALLAMQGAGQLDRPALRVPLGAPYRQRPGRLGLVRVRLEGQGGDLRAWPLDEQGSGILSSLVRGDALMPVAPEVSELGAGEPVTVWPLAWKES